MSLATLTQLVDDKLRSLRLGTAADAGARDRAIGQAVLQYGKDAPAELVDLVVGTANGVIAVPAGWQAGLSSIDALEYPIGQTPMATIAAALQFNGTTHTILALDLAQGETARLHFTVPVTADTIPATHENAVACWAAAELCRQLATAAAHDRDASISAVAVMQQSTSGELARRAKEWLAVYRTTLGLPDPEKAGQAGGVGGGTVVSWGARRQRGRLSSWGG